MSEERQLHGLQKVCKAIGSIKINGTTFVWDYVKDIAVEEKEMKAGTERWAASERAKYAHLRKP